MNLALCKTHLVGASLLTALIIAPCASGQSTNRTARPRGSQGPQVVSPEVSADRHITFRILAPKATEVRLSNGDIQLSGQDYAMSKGTNGVWELTLGPIGPGSYRYAFTVDGLTVIDPRSPKISESNNNIWSLVDVPGSEFMDTREVPHGAVAAVTYHSQSLGKFRRLHVYTPPGYEKGDNKYPVFYLLHGASDSDDSWSSVGRAGFILDNLIAAQKAKPMIVVMPAGHTRGSGPASRSEASTNAPARSATDEFVEDFTRDIMPYVEKTYRVSPGRQNRAMAGLSMGGSQTLNVGIPNLEKFGYLGVFSSGLIGSFARRGGSTNAPTGPSWEEQHKAELDNAAAREGLKLFWFATGKDDFLIETTRGTVSMLKKHGFDPVLKETSGGHTWLNWRDYLIEFVPQLFQ